jgi:uncharacterized protein
MHQPEQVIQHTKKWIKDVVIGCNFCPFAAKEVKAGTIHYEVCDKTDIGESLVVFLQECKRLDVDSSLETSLLIFPNSFREFDMYLNLVTMAERLLTRQHYEGIYQVASFHPLYCFEGVSENDASNYTNRSPYPMLHLLREERIEQALARYPHPEQIPTRNINFAREKGEVYMKMLRDACFGNQ